MDKVTAYPLSWPDGWPRTNSRKRFAPYKTSFFDAFEAARRELKLFKAFGVVISTDVALRRDGLPYADGDAGARDPGVFTADQLVAHAVGDYVLQSDWMATEKTRKHFAALAHAVVYGSVFVMLRASHTAIAFIVATHFVIDRWRLARYVVWAKNWIGGQPPPWRECTATGYPPDRPVWLTTWLLIIADNVLHVFCNAAALRWL